MHPALVKIQRATLESKFSGQIWLVGGAVRDRLMKRDDPSDLDLVVEGDALELVQMLSATGLSTIPPVTYPRFGTAMLRIEGANVEFVTARKESYDEESRKPDVEPATLIEDATRRDFTVNTLLINLHSEKLYDPLALGVDDMVDQVLRTPRDPDQTFHDDPLRMLRAVRFRWKLGFEPAPGLYDSIKRNGNRLMIVSKERIRDELNKMFELRDADRCLQDLMDLGLLKHFAPEFEPMVGVEQGSYHHLDVWEHTLLVVRNTGAKNLDLSLAALLHDVAKPATRTVEADGRTRFFGHETIGARMAEKILWRLRYPHDTIDNVSLLVKSHMRLATLATFTKPAARRLVRDLGSQMENLLLLTEADAGALKPGVRQLDLGHIRQGIELVQTETPASALESPLSGEEIMAALHLEPGPTVGQAKEWLTEQVIEGHLESGDKDTARVLLENFESRSPGSGFGGAARRILGA